MLAATDFFENSGTLHLTAESTKSSLERLALADADTHSADTSSWRKLRSGRSGETAGPLLHPGVEDAAG